MASDQSASAPPSAQVVGNAFIQQFYQILHQSPDVVYRFYQENSKLGRADAHGAMSSVTSIQAINEKILSMEYSDYRAEIKTVDAQESLNGGVIVLVTGYLTGKDNVKRDFTQSFFLAPQEKGFYVLNDICRYMDEVGHGHGSLGLANGNVSAPILPEQDSAPPPDQHVLEQTASSSDEEEASEEEVYNPSDNEESLVVEKEEVVELAITEVPSVPPVVVAESVPVTVHEDAPKKSYASIVKVMKENNAPLSVPALAPARPPITQERQPAPAPGPAPAPEISISSSNASESSNVQEAEADGYSIYVKNLPLSATPAQLEEEFKQFGPIKPGGIQVRSHKMQGFCFGFVEFEVASAVQSAIEASSIMIGGRQVYIEEKRTTGSRVSSRGRFPPGRGSGLQNDAMRGRGGYGRGRGYGRGDYGNRADFGNRGGGRARGGDVGYQRVDQGSSGGRGSRSGYSTSAGPSPKSVTPHVPDPA